MNDATIQVHQSTTLGQQQTETHSSTAAAPPLPHRRPRVREVSSRFMSSVASPSGAATPFPRHTTASTPTPTPPEVQFRQQQQHRSKSVQRRRQEPTEPFCGGGGGGGGSSSNYANDNENLPPPPDTIRSLDTPLGLLHNSRLVSAHRRKQQRASVKLLKENGGRAEQQQQQQQHLDVSQSRTISSGKFHGSRSANAATPSRPDTPALTGAMDRMISSRFRLGTPRPTSAAAVTAAAKLLQSSGMSATFQPPNPDSTINGDASKETTAYFPINTSSAADTPSDEKDITQTLDQIPKLIGSYSHDTTIMCSSSPISLKNSKTWSTPDLCSSMPEVDVLPNLSSRLQAERTCNIDAIGCDSSKLCVSTFSRSLNNLPLSSCEHSSHSHTVKASEKPPPVLTKPFANSVKIGSLCLPPLPSSKMGADSRRERKTFSHQGEVHSLKLHHNHYLQWRYANARAEATLQSQKRETERKLYSLAIKISDLHDLVKRKHIELGLWKQAKILSSILEAHMPHLDEWSTLEGEYSSSLSEAIHALLNASLQIPVGVNVQADKREVGEALNSAVKMTETIYFHIQSYLPKAEEMDALISELARVVRGQSAFIEECGHLLFKTYTSQVEECSLRGHLIQLHRANDLEDE